MALTELERKIHDLAVQIAEPSVKELSAPGDATYALDQEHIERLEQVREFYEIIGSTTLLALPADVLDSFSRISSDLLAKVRDLKGFNHRLESNPVSALNDRYRHVDQKFRDAYNTIISHLGYARTSNQIIDQTIAGLKRESENRFNQFETQLTEIEKQAATAKGV